MNSMSILDFIGSYSLAIFEYSTRINQSLLIMGNGRFGLDLFFKISYCQRFVHFQFVFFITGGSEEKQVSISRI